MLVVNLQAWPMAHGPGNLMPPFPTDGDQNSLILIKLNFNPGLHQQLTSYSTLQNN